MPDSRTIKIAAITGGLNTPSARFRIRQYIPHLKDRNIFVDELIPHFGKSSGWPSPVKTISRIPALVKSRRADIIWFNKELVQGYATLENLFKHPRLLDADDAIWLNLPFGRWAVPYIAKNADAVIAGNDYLAEYFSRYCRNVYIVPTAVDLSRYPADIQQKSNDRFIIGWTGLACNYKYIAAIERPLTEFLKNHKDAILRVISNREPKFRIIPAEKIEYIRWTPENEISSLCQFDIGIMPLTRDKWTLGKCSFKMLQYMAAFVPSVVSPVGMNRQIMRMDDAALSADSDTEWYNALETLYNDRSLCRTMGKTGRKIIAENFDTPIIADKLARIFRQICT